MQQVQKQQHLTAALPGVQQVVWLLPLVPAAPAPAPAAAPVAAAAVELLAAAAYPPVHQLQVHCCCRLPHPAVLLLVLLVLLPLLELLVVLLGRWGHRVMQPRKSG